MIYAATMILLSLIPVVPQDDDSLCGAYCLHVALRGVDAKLPSFDDLKQTLGPPKSGGYSLAQLADAAEHYQVHTLGVLTTPDRLVARSEPFSCIAKMGANHFVCIAGIRDGVVHVIDPPRAYEIPLSSWQTSWGGEALLISADPLAAEEAIGSGFGRRSLVVQVVTGSVLLVCGALLWRRSTTARS